VNLQDRRYYLTVGRGTTEHGSTAIAVLGNAWYEADSAPLHGAIVEARQRRAGREDSHLSHGAARISTGTSMPVVEGEAVYVAEYLWTSGELYTDLRVDAATSVTWPESEHISFPLDTSVRDRYRCTAPYTHTLLYFLLHSLMGANMLTLDNHSWVGPEHARRLHHYLRFFGLDGGRDLTAPHLAPGSGVRGYKRLSRTRRATVAASLTQTPSAALIVRGRIEMVLVMALFAKIACLHCTPTPRQTVASLETLGVQCLRVCDDWDVRSGWCARPEYARCWAFVWGFNNDGELLKHSIVRPRGTTYRSILVDPELNPTRPGYTGRMFGVTKVDAWTLRVRPDHLGLCVTLEDGTVLRTQMISGDRYHTTGLESKAYLDVCGVVYFVAMEDPDMPLTEHCVSMCRVEQRVVTKAQGLPVRTVILA